jgi:ketosteroid isomerase-like protein
MNAKELVTEYYTSAAFKNAEAMGRYLHDDIVMQWHSSKGFLQLDKSDLTALVAELEKSYCDARLEVSHIVADGDTVSVRYTHYVNAFENPAEEMVLAHFVVIWEVQDNKFYKGYLMSQLG